MQLDQLRVLVTGASGFVGCWLVPELLRAGCSVTATHHDREARGPAEVAWVPCELSDPRAVWSLVERTAPEAVIHLAALAVPRDARRSPLRAMECNYAAVHHLSESLRACSPRARLLFVSSGEVYGRRGRTADPAREADRLSPENIYAATKVAAERLLELSFRDWGLDVVCARPFNHTGPGRPDRYAESSFARQIAEAEKSAGNTQIHVGNLEAERDYLDVRDVVRAYLRLLERGVSGQTYNVCSGRARSIDSILELLVSRARTRIEVRTDPSRFERTPEGRERLVGCPDALRALGWTPEVALEDTLGQLLDQWRGATDVPPTGSPASSG